MAVPQNFPQEFSGTALNQVLKSFENSPTLSRVTVEWKSLALKLRSNTDNIRCWQADILLERQNVMEVLEAILIDWKLRLGSQATLEYLIFTIESLCGWTEVADQLRLSVNRISKKTRTDYFWKQLPYVERGDLLSRTVLFLGHRCKLFDLGSKIEDNTFRQILEESLNGSELTLFSESLEYKLAPFDIPSVLPYYMERKLQTHIQVGFGIWSENTTDIFLVDGIEFGAFAAIINTAEVDRSSNQLKLVTAQFILLENISHYNTICLGTTRNLHYLSYKDRTFYWNKSRGDIDKILKHMQPEVNIIKEANMINGILSEHNPVCICILSGPGTGKSEFLKSLTCGLYKKYPDRVVIYLSLIKFVESIVHQKTEISCSNIRELVANMVSANTLGYRICFEILSNEANKVELVFENYHNLTLEHKCTADSILSELLNNAKNTRIYIGSNAKLKLSATNKIYYCSMQPFSSFDEKEQFLYNHLKEKTFMQNNIDIENFVQIFARKFEEVSVRTENAICGFALHGAMLTEVLLYKLIRDDFADAAINIDLYAPLFNTVEEVIGIAYPTKRYKQVLVKLALATIFASNHQTSELISKFPLPNSNILQQNGKCFQFMHHVFAEYLTAEFFFEVLQGKIPNEFLNLCPEVLDMAKILNFVLEVDLNETGEFEFVRPAYAYFLNAKMQCSGMQNDKYIVSKINTKLDFASEFGPVITTVLDVCATGQYTALFCILVDCLFSSGSNALSSPVTFNSKDWYQLCVKVCENGHIELVRKTFELYESSNNSPHPLNILYDSKFENTLANPLHISARRGCFENFRYFWKKYEGRKECIKGILHALVENTSQLGIGNIIEREHILSFVLTVLGKAVLDEENNNFLQPILMPRIHLRILKKMITSGANVDFAAPSFDNVAHNVASVFDPEQYDEFVNFLLIEKGKRGLFKVKNFLNETPLCTAFRHFTVQDKTLELLIKSGEVNMDSDLGFEDTLMYHLIRRGYSPSMIKIALGHSPDWQYMTYKDKSTTLLHVAAYWGNSEAVRHFLDEGLDVNSRNSEGQTPLHVACSRVCTKEVSVFNLNVVIEELLGAGADSQLLDNEGKDALSYFHGYPQCVEKTNIFKKEYL